jgi:hypothetical protein
MKTTILTLILAFSLCANAEFNYDSYKPESIETAIKNLSVDPKADYFFEAGVFKYRTAVVFTGNHRNTIDESRDFIENWVTALGLPAEYKKMFPFEVEVKQGDKLYWLPIQKSLVQPFAAEVMPGSSVLTYIMTAGAINQRPIFLMNEFQAK